MRGLIWIDLQGLEEIPWDPIVPMLVSNWLCFSSYSNNFPMGFIFNNSFMTISTWFFFFLETIELFLHSASLCPNIFSPCKLWVAFWMFLFIQHTPLPLLLSSQKFLSTNSNDLTVQKSQKILKTQFGRKFFPAPRSLTGMGIILQCHQNVMEIPVLKFKKKKMWIRWTGRFTSLTTNRVLCSWSRSFKFTPWYYF